MTETNLTITKDEITFLLSNQILLDEIKDRRISFLNYIISLYGSEDNSFLTNKKDYFHKTIQKFFEIIKRVLKKKDKIQKTDILFISRDRYFEEVCGNKKYISDYLFYEIINILKNKEKDKTIMLWNNAVIPRLYYNTKTAGYYDFISPIGLISILYKSIYKYFHWKIKSNTKSTMLKTNSSNQIQIYVGGFFSFKKIFNDMAWNASILNIIKYLDPRVIVGNDDILFLKPKSCINSKIPIVVIQSARTLKLKEKNINLMKHILHLNHNKVEEYLCSGPYFKKLKKLSRISKHISITGQPRYDYLFKNRTIFNKSIIYTKLNISNKKTILLWTTETHGLSMKENNLNLKIMNTLIKDNTDLFLIVKLHPEENSNNPMFKLLSNCNIKIVQFEFNIFELINCCDILITKTSTTAMEAILLDKPIIILDLLNNSDYIEYSKEHVGCTAKTKQQLEFLIRNKSNINIFNPYFRQKYIENYLGEFDGQASMRCAEVIRSYL